MKRKWFKLMVSMLTVVSLTGALYGCGQKNTANNEVTNNEVANNEVTKEKANLTVATWAGAGELDEFQEIVDELNANSEDYNLKIQSIPADYYKKIQTMISAKQAPDLMWLSQEYIPMYASIGALMDITDKANEDSNVGLDNYFDGPLNTAKYQDKLYGLPWISQPVVMYYNEDMLNEAGIELPNNEWKWEDFRNAAKKVTKDNDGDGKLDQWGTVIDGWPPIHTWLWTFGAESVDAQGNVKIDSPEAIKGLNTLHGIINEDNISPSKEQAQSMGNADLFKTGKIAFFFGGAGDDLEKKVDGKFKVGMSEIPYETEKSTFSWIASTVVSSQTKNQDAAYKALIDLTNATHEWKIVPPVKTGLDMVTKNRPEKEYAMDVIRKSSEYARGFYNQEKQAEIDAAIWDEAYGPILNGSKTGEQAAKDAAEKVKSIMGQ